MEVMKGYKQTEVGVIPKDWKVKQIQEVCKLINGRGFKPHEWKKEGLPIIRIQNLNGSEEFNYYQGEHSSKIVIEEGQLLFAWSGSRGTSFGPHIWKGEKGVLNYHTWKVNVFNSKVDKDFFLHGLRQLTKSIEDKAHGASALVHTQKWEMEGFKIPLPPNKSEQSSIAKVLSETDSLIANLEKLIAKKETIKKGTMQALLTGKKRLPGFSEKWRTKKLSEIGKPFGGLTGKSKKDFENGKQPYIPFMNVMSNAIVDIGYFDYVTIGSSENQNKVLKGDLLFNGSSETPEEVGMCSALLNDVPNLYLNSFCFGFRLNKELHANALFLSYFFRSSVGRRLFYSSAQGATRYNLSKNNFLKIEIPFPKPEEQEAIADVIKDLENEVLHLKDKAEKVRIVKQGMMQNLLTGKIRLV